MSVLSVNIQLFLQGFYSLIWIAILLDVGSPSLDLRRLGEWAGPQVAVAVVLIVAFSFVIGLMMHTLSRHLFRKHKARWEARVLLSPSVRRRFSQLGLESAVRELGGSTFEEIDAAGDADRVRMVGEVLHGMDYALLVRAPHVYRSIQMYRSQYRLARGFIIPSAVLALLMPFWEPIAGVPSGRMVGPFNLVAVQLFLLSVLLASVAFVSFRERAFRYEAARTRAFMVVATNQ